MKKQHYKLLLYLLSVALWVSCQRPDEPSKKPNFLVIVVDDLGYHDLSCTGSDYYETPNIDEIANSGFQFTRGYSTCAVCSPSRASLLTGLSPIRHGITDYIGARTGADWREMGRFTRLLPTDYTPHLPFEYTTLPEKLKEHGYRNFFAGKWHLGSEEQQSLPTDHGFDINKGGFHQGGPYTGGFFSPFNNPFLEDRPEEVGMSLSMKLANETAAFIKENQDSSFLAYLCFYAVHAPIQTTEEKWSYFRAKADSMGIAEDGFEMERVLPIRKQQDNPVYAGLIEQVDDAVGLVLETLRETGLDDNTVIVFTSDNGGVASGDNYSTNSLTLRGGKGYQWEGGTRVPYFVQVPWLAAGQKIENPVTGADLFPTLLDLANLPLAPELHQDGNSLLPLMQNEPFPTRPLYWHYPHYGNQGGEPHAIIQEGQWKLIHYWEDSRSELYDLSVDAGEKKNLVSAASEQADQMKTRLLTWLEEAGARLPVLEADWDSVSHAAVLNRYQEVLLPRLEQQRQEMLSPDWTPNEDWWGSKVSTQTN
ncbi:MAG: sulfatase [Bacteroidota bacterium]